MSDLLIVNVVGKPTTSFFLQNGLNPLMIPRSESPGDNCHGALIVVELVAITVKTISAVRRVIP